MKRLAWFVYLVGTSLSLSLAACGDDGAPAGNIDAAMVVFDSAVPDSSPPGTPDARPMNNHNPDGSVGVTCDTMTCTGTDECCVTPADGGAQFACVAPGTCQGAAVTCDGPEDCGGKACCGTFSGMTASAECSTQTSCMGLTLQFCHNDNDCPAAGGPPTCCPAGPGGYCKPPQAPMCF